MGNNVACVASFPNQTLCGIYTPGIPSPQALRLPYGDARMRHVMTKYDADNSGSIELVEFTHYMSVGPVLLHFVFHAHGVSYPFSFDLVACSALNMCR